MHPSSSLKMTRSVIEKGNEDESFITGYRPNIPKTLLCHLVSIVLCGIPYLLAHWKPKWRLSGTCSICPLWQAEKVLIKHKESRDVYIVDVVTVRVSDAFAKQYAIPKNTSSGDTSKLLEEQENEYSFRYFIYRHLRYGWNQENGCFAQIQGLDSDITTADLIQDYGNGVSCETSSHLLELHGENSISVEIPTYLNLLIQEVLHPFYIFQLCSITLWSLDEYMYYAACIFIISVISVSISLYETRKQAESLHDMVANTTEGKFVVKRGDRTQYLDSCDLVPGDLLVLPRSGSCIMTCDAVLLTGTAIVNEAMLTGESVPVTKSSLPRLDEEELYNVESHKRHTLFDGTEVIQTRFYGDQDVVALVVRTGFHTAKGELIRSILFPRPMDFKFYRDSIRFILVLFCLAAVGMVYCVYLYLERGAPFTMIILRTLDIITIVVPPALPAAMTVGTVYAQSRLKKKMIYCISPARINVCGKLKLLCFDKTGTLTEDGLDLKSVIPATEAKFQEEVEDLTNLNDEDNLKMCLASCHSLTTINNVLTGDPLDAKMFEGTGWMLEEQGTDESKYDKMMPTVVKPKQTDLFSIESLPLELGIIRQFTFSSSLARMSVIVRDLRGSNFIIFTKGAPEKLEDICVPESLPDNFHNTLRDLTIKGYRVIALAYRPMSEQINYLKVQKMKRDVVEKDLIFLGFLVMQNTLKPETQGVIRELKDAALKIVMITGDNMLTGISVARDSRIIDPADRVVIMEAVTKPDGNLCLEFQDAEGNSDDNTIIASDGGLQNSYQNGSVRIHLEPDVHLALTGKAWNVLIKHFPELVPRVLVRGTVFARMSPDQKAQLVEEFQTLGYIVSMCGDGANDCGALKAAHVGVSLSEAEASVAAPFTSKIQNISCIPKLILEGRCALTTSFGVFKYMALYSMIQFISVIILYTNRTNLGDTQYLYIDLVITTTVAVLMGRTKPWNVLVKQRPPGSLVAGSTLFSIVCQILATLAAQVVAQFYLQSQIWYNPVDPTSPDEEIVKDATTTSIFIVSSFQYLVLATVFSKGPPYRQPFYTNLLYLAALLGLSGFTAVLLFIPDWPQPWLQNFFELESLTMPFKVGVGTIIAVNAVVNILIEFGVNTGTWVKKFTHIITRKRGPKNRYKLVLKDLDLDVGWPRDNQSYPLNEEYEQSSYTSLQDINQSQLVSQQNEISAARGS